MAHDDYEDRRRNLGQHVGGGAFDLPGVGADVDDQDRLSHIARIKEALERITPWPWTAQIEKYYGELEVWGIQGKDGKRIVETDSGHYPPGLEDAKFIANAPTWLRQLVEENESLQREVERSYAEEAKWWEKACEQKLLAEEREKERNQARAEMVKMIAERGSRLEQVCRDGITKYKAKRTYGTAMAVLLNIEDALAALDAGEEGEDG